MTAAWSHAGFAGFAACDSGTEVALVDSGKLNVEFCECPTELGGNISMDRVGAVAAITGWGAG
jgi:hypothetical protein